MKFVVKLYWFCLPLIIGCNAPKDLRFNSIDIAVEVLTDVVYDNDTVDNTYIEISLKNLMSNESIVFDLSEENTLPNLQPYYSTLVNCTTQEISWRGSLDPYYYSTIVLTPEETINLKVNVNQRFLKLDECSVDFVTIGFEEKSKSDRGFFGYKYVYIPLTIEGSNILTGKPIVGVENILAEKFDYIELGFSSDGCDSCM